jgi:hypothetical protein
MTVQTKKFCGTIFPMNKVTKLANKVLLNRFQQYTQLYTMTNQVSFQRLKFFHYLKINHYINWNKTGTPQDSTSVQNKILSEKEEQLPQLIKNRYKNPTANLILMVEDWKLSPEIGTRSSVYFQHCYSTVEVKKAWKGNKAYRLDRKI